MYKQRLQSIFKEKSVSANTQKRLLAELSTSAAGGKEHALYVKLCKRHGIAPEPEYVAASSSEAGDVERKQELAESALEKVVASVKGGAVQWALVGEEGAREYVDFNKAMQGGTMNNMQMGPHVADALHAAFGGLASEHSHTLTSAIAEAPRLYDAGLHKTFCFETVPSCKRKGSDDRDEL